MMKNDIWLDKINRTIGNTIIKNNHYSGTVNAGTKYTLGVFHKDYGLCGVIQLGTGVNPSKTKDWVKGTNTNEFLELNRLWVGDELGKNSESHILSLMIKWVKKHNPKIQWLVSFADGAEGKVGTIYQASNWVYSGYNHRGGIWYDKDGNRYHGVKLHLLYGDTKRKTLEEHLGTPLYRVVGGQFRYFYFLNHKARKNYIGKTKPYPKHSELRKYLKIKKSNWETEDLWDEFNKLLSNK
jgi:hypothetical protein